MSSSVRDDESATAIETLRRNGFPVERLSFFAADRKTDRMLEDTPQESGWQPPRMIGNHTVVPTKQTVIGPHGYCERPESRRDLKDIPPVEYMRWDPAICSETGKKVLLDVLGFPWMCKGCNDPFRKIVHAVFCPHSRNFKLLTQSGEPLQKKAGKRAG